MSFYINGNEPSITGKVCKGFYLIQHQEGESITDQANVAFLKFDNNWVKLYFDGGTIFWREGEEPSEPINSSLSSCLSLLNLSELEGVIDQKLTNIVYGGDEKHVWANLVFSNDKKLIFKHYGYDDYTKVNY